jgi:hypothetical protein
MAEGWGRHSAARSQCDALGGDERDDDAHEHEHEHE